MLGSSCSPCCAAPPAPPNCGGQTTNVYVKQLAGGYPVIGGTVFASSRSYVLSIRVSGTLNCGGEIHPTIGIYTTSGWWIAICCLLDIPSGSPATITLSGTVPEKYSYAMMGLRQQPSTRDCNIIGRGFVRDYVGSSSWPFYPSHAPGYSSAAFLHRVNRDVPPSGCSPTATFSLTGDLPAQANDVRYELEVLLHPFFGYEGPDVSLDATVSW